MNGSYFLFDNGHIRKDVVEQTNKEKSKVGIDQDLLHTHYFHNPHMLSVMSQLELLALHPNTMSLHPNTMSLHEMLTYYMSSIWASPSNFN